MKPLAPASVALLPFWRPASGTRPAAKWIAFAAAASTLGVALLWGGALLPRMLDRTATRLPEARSLSLGRLLQCAGLDLPPLLLLVLAVAAGAWLLQLRARPVAGFAVLATTAALYASPLVWTHTLALSLPAQVIAFERLTGAWRRAPAGSPDRRRHGLVLMALGACALAIQGSEALAAIDGGPPLAQALFIAPVVLSPALFAFVALRRGADEPGSFGLAATVGQ